MNGIMSNTPEKKKKRRRSMTTLLKSHGHHWITDCAILLLLLPEANIDRDWDVSTSLAFDLCLSVLISAS
jgi:hypothetical protein